MNLLQTKYFVAFTKVSRAGYLVAFVMFCTSAAHFMALPFLAIYLAREGLFSSGQIGMVLAISGLMLSMTGLVNGLFLDRSSHKKTILVSLLLSGFCYFCFSFSMHLFFLLLLLNAIIGWSRSFIQIGVLSIIVAHTKPENLSYAYSARFIASNLGVVLGPLIGALMAIHQSLFIFYIAGLIHILLGILMFLYAEKKIISEEPQPSIHFWSGFREVFKDKQLVALTIINLILWTVYSQIDTTLPQFLAHVWKNPAVLFSILMVINAGICVIFQPLILRWAELNSQKISGIIGCILFISAFVLLIFPTTTFLMISAVILMSFAELFTLPINSLLVMRVAPKHMIASYNGFYSLGLLGMSLGPFLGGYGLQYIGGPYTFLIVAHLPLIAAWIYYKFFTD